MLTAALLVVGLVIALAISLALAVAHWTIEKKTEKRLREAGELSQSLIPEPDEERGALGNWLYLAGFKMKGADWLFVLITLVLVALGLSCAYLLLERQVIEAMAVQFENMPGGIGNMFLPVVFLLPWLVFILPALIPTMIVLHSRRIRVAQVENDLPLFLELMATLTESGLSFDAALTRILKTQRKDRPLSVESLALQKDILAGRSRIVAFRRMSRRLEVLPLTIFISAIIQSEQVGAGLAETLRAQAENIRTRRRDEALSRVMAAPTRMLFPMAICFLPAIFVFAMGPSFYTVMQFVESVASQVPR